MGKMFEGDSANMNIRAIIEQSEIGDIIAISDDPERVWKVSEKTNHQLTIVNEEIKKTSGCEGCGGSNFLPFAAFGSNSYQCQDCGWITTITKARVISAVIINDFANLSLDKRLSKDFVRAEETEEVVEEATI